VLAVNAGVYEFGTLGEITEEHFDKTFNTNVRGLLFTVQKALPLLRKGSSVILTGSMVSIKGFAACSVYNASRAAVRSFARTWIVDLKGRDIRINVLSPGYTDTPGLSQFATDEQRLRWPFRFRWAGPPPLWSRPSSMRYLRSRYRHTNPSTSSTASPFPPGPYRQAILKPLVVLERCSRLHHKQFEALIAWLRRRELGPARWVVRRQPPDQHCCARLGPLRRARPPSSTRVSISTRPS
jgi:NAD(P)-dependent dehydrogenase (short-subunit alcohol dehydrogenase family)